MTKCPIILHAVLILLATAAASPGAAQNLIVNPNFDTDTSDWTGIGEWDIFDVDASPASGSASYINTSAGVAGFSVVLQCITIDPTAVGYDITAWTYVPSGQVAAGFARVDLAWYTDTLCNDYLTFSEFYPPGLFDTWERAGGPAFRPHTALSVRVSAVNQKLGPGSFQVYADAFSLEPNLSSMLFGDSFESGDPGAWSAVILGPS